MQETLTCEDFITHVARMQKMKYLEVLNPFGHSLASYSISSENNHSSQAVENNVGIWVGGTHHFTSFGLLGLLSSTMDKLEYYWLAHIKYL